MGRYEIALGKKPLTGWEKTPLKMPSKEVVIGGPDRKRLYSKKKTFRDYIELGGPWETQFDEDIPWEV